MLITETNQVYQSEFLLASSMVVAIVWFLALIEFILAMVLLAQNVSTSANASHRRARFWPCIVLLLLTSSSTLITGIMTGSPNPTRLRAVAFLLAGLIPAIPPWIFITAIALLNPDWSSAPERSRASIRHNWKEPLMAYLVPAMYALAFLPALLSGIDALSGTHLWVSGATSQTLGSDLAHWTGFTDGALAPLLRILNLRIIPILTLFLLLTMLFSAAPHLRRTTWALLITQICVLTMEFGLRWAIASRIWGNFLVDLAMATLLSTVYGFIAVQQQLSSTPTRRAETESPPARPSAKSGQMWPESSLQVRITLLILAGALPILFALTAFLVNRLGMLLRPLVTEPEVLAQIDHFQGLAWGALIVGGLILAIFTWFTVRQATEPLNRLITSTKSMADQVYSGKLDQILPVESADTQTAEIDILANSFNRITSQLRKLVNELEQRVEKRTAELQRRAIQLQTAAQVAREAAAIQDLKLLLSQATQLISKRFGFYHAGIFLIDETGEYAILQAASSQGGQRMLERGHKLRVGKMGIVGYVAATARPRIAMNVGEDAVYFDNPDLPLTRSEMALPLKARGQVIGVLDVQSTNVRAFTEEDIEVLQILADQIALAIENARLLGEREAALKELEAQYGETTRQAWRQQIWRQQGAGKPVAYHYNRLEVKPVFASELQNSPIPSHDQANPLSALDGQVPTVHPGSALRQIVLPITIRNQTIGTIFLRRDEDQEPWTIADYNLVEEAMQGISQALENARLLDENQRRAQQERVIGEVAAKVQSSLDLDTLMKMAVREVALATQAARVQIRLGNEPEFHSESGQGRPPETDANQPSETKG